MILGRRELPSLLSDQKQQLLSVSQVVERPARRMVKVEETEGPEFKWGMKKAIGGKNKATQFYKSFTFDGEQYDLYDCVYLYKEGEPEPEIGKIIKMWETPQRIRRVKILWFFRPCEIINFLGDEEILENELFLASGVGTGLYNLNPVEAIAGKCNVLCISKDKEDPQPSDEELQKADFVFYRTFDVSLQKIMDKIEGKIADVDVKFLFNRMNIQKPAGDLNVDLGKNKVCGNDTTSNETMVPSKQNSFKEHINLETTGNSFDKHKLCVEKRISAVGLESSEMDKTDERQQDMSSPKTVLSSKGKSREEEVNLDNVLPRKLEVEETISTKEVGDLDNRPTKKVKLDTSKASSDDRNSHEQRHVEAEENSNNRKSNAILEHTQLEKANMNASRSSEHKHKINANGSYMKDLSPIASPVDERCKRKGVEDTIGTNKSHTKKMKPDGNATIPSNDKLPKSLHGDGKSKAQKALSPSSSTIDDKCKHKDGGESLVVDKDSKKKMKVGDKATSLSTSKPPRPTPRPPKNKAQKFDGQVLEVTRHSDASNVDGNDNKTSSPIAFGFDDSLGKHKAPFEKMKSDVKAPRLSNRELREQSSTQSQNKSQKLDGQVVEVTQRPGADRRKWFKKFPWQERMQAAHEQGTLILLQNLDPAYTSAEVEDIVWNGLGESCTAKMIQQTANSSPYSGQALVIFKTRETAQKVARKLEEGCLLLSNGRPLVGSTATTPCSTEKKPHFFGHLVIDKLRHPMLNEREMKEAVSTSHFSQPNTIEYDMSMEWCAQQEKSDLLWKNLYKQQWKEVRELKAKLKAK
ncbi:protein ANTI-SILENCING 1 [Rosa rugosa]|uniref:protein ANTI-SILENCING 1 n=1 Tax=Rosa rugosa TaxID=74645 RepID=UPI002B4049C5|nr:protein ANTI-SILENCING 1 [Rosa rugosa]